MKIIYHGPASEVFIADAGGDVRVARGESVEVTGTTGKELTLLRPNEFTVDATRRKAEKGGEG